MSGRRGLCRYARVHVMRIARAPTRRLSFHVRSRSRLSLRSRRRTLVPRSRASAHRAFQTRRRWRASATWRLRARRRLTDFCNTFDVRARSRAAALHPATGAKTPTAPHRSPATRLEATSRATREVNIALPCDGSDPTEATPSLHPAQTKHEGRVASSEGSERFGRWEAPPRLRPVHPLSRSGAYAWTETHA
jgi:hypothetical protein